MLDFSCIFCILDEHFRQEECYRTIFWHPKI